MAQPQVSPMLRYDYRPDQIDRPEQPMYVTQSARMGYSESAPAPVLTGEAEMRSVNQISVIRCRNGFRVILHGEMTETGEFVFNDRVEMLEWISSWLGAR